MMTHTSERLTRAKLRHYTETLLTPDQITLLAAHNVPLTGPGGLRRYLAERSFAAFLDLYFADEFTIERAPIHEQFISDIEQMATRYLSGQQGLKLARAIPRGIGKSTYFSRLGPLWRLLNGSSPLTVLIGNTQSAAERLLKNIRAAFETNPAIQADYPEVNALLWSTSRIDGPRGVIVAFGRGNGAIRGIATPQRPAWVILDDVDDDDLCRSAVELAATIEWWRKAVLPLGDNIQGRTSFTVVGTVIRKQSLLADILSSPEFDSVVQQGIISFPTNTALVVAWEQWFLREALLGRAPPDYEHDSFWQAHKDALEAGATVLWPQLGGKLLYQYLRYRLAYGERAFRSEVQNALDDSDLQALGAYPVVPRIQVPPRHECERLLSIDPSEGRNPTSDYAAVVDVLFHYTTRRLYVIWATTEHQGYNAVIDTTVNYITSRGTYYDGVWCETNGLGGIFADLLQQRLAQAGSDVVPIRHYSRIPKVERITLLGELARQGRLAFADDLPDAVRAEWEGFPTARHDHALDAIATIALKLREQGRLDVHLPERQTDVGQFIY